MKKEYTKPEILLSRFSTEDIITVSGVDNDSSDSTTTTTPSEEPVEMSLKNYPVEQNLDDII